MRYKKVKREEGICQYCDLGEIEDENHFFWLVLNIQFKGELKLEYILSLSELMSLAAPFIKQSLAMRKVDSTAAQVI